MLPVVSPPTRGHRPAEEKFVLDRFEVQGREATVGCGQQIVQVQRPRPAVRAAQGWVGADGLEMRRVKGADLCSIRFLELMKVQRTRVGSEAFVVVVVRGWFDAFNNFLLKITNRAFICETRLILFVS